MSKPTSTIETETFVAYVDGELDAAEEQRVEAALRHDPQLQRMVAELQQGTALLRAAFNEPSRRSGPDPAAALIAGASVAGSRSGGWSDWRPLSALAATVVAVLASGSIGYFAASEHLNDRVAALEDSREQDRAELVAAVSAVLEDRLSGQTVNWTDPDSGYQLSVTPVRTFRSGAGQWCREYVETAILGTDVERRRAVACREDSGQWKNRVELLEES